MKKCTFLLALFFPLSTFAQLSGNVEGGGSWNFDKGHKEDVKLNLRLDTTKMSMAFNISGGHKYNPTTETTSILDMKDKNSAYSKYENKALYKRNWYVNTGLDFKFKLTSQDNLNMGLQYGYKGDKDHPLLSSSRYTLSADTILGTQQDTSNTREHIFKPKLAYTHVFTKSDNKIYVGITGLIDMKEEGFNRITQGKFYSKNRYYTTLSSLNDVDTRIEAYYQDASLGKVKDLNFKGGVDFVWHNDVDIFAGWNNVNGQWRDSTNLDRSHLYSSFALEPNVSISYKYKGFEFYVNERVQWYHHQLINRLNEKTSLNQYEFRRSEWQNILSANVGYKFNTRHRLDLTYQRLLERPNYEKLNPAFIIGKSEGEYFKGNPNLRPTTKDEVGLTYGFMAEHFGTDLTMGYRYTKDKVEKMLDVAKADSTIFTYINTKKQHTGGLTLDLKVDYEAVKAKMWLGTFYDMFVKDDNTIDKTDFNFEVGMSLDAYLTPSMKLSSQLLYRSAKASLYNLKGEYIGADISLTKTFTIEPYATHHALSFLDLYVKVSDLVDKPDYEQTWNADYTYYKVIEKTLNRRSINIGINYKF